LDTIKILTIKEYFLLMEQLTK